MNKPPRHIQKVSSTNSCAKRLLEKVLTCLASREEFGEDVLAEAVQLPECRCSYGHTKPAGLQAMTTVPRGQSHLQKRFQICP